MLISIFLEIFEKMYMMVYVFATFCGCSIKNNEWRYNFALPYLKRALKSPVNTGLNWVISGPFTDIPVQLYKVQFNKTYLKTLS